MARYQTGEKSVSEPMLVSFADAYMRNSASIS